MVIVNYLIFPGFLFSLTAGGFIWWIERKLTARFQYRIGPPWYQNYIDILKLFFKETIIPRDSIKPLFISSPIISFASMLLASAAIGQVYFLRGGFGVDTIVILYLLILPSLFIILGGLSNPNPLSITGASREIKLMLSYEFIFICTLLIAIIKSGGSISLSAMVGRQEMLGAHIKNISGIIGFILGIFYLQAKLGIVPFDVAEAEQEIMAGPFIEYSGPLLGFFKLTKAIGYFSLPLFIIALFWPSGGWHLIYKFILIVLLMSVIKNINPRLRIKDALKFFWFFLFPLGIFGIILSILGY